MVKDYLNPKLGESNGKLAHHRFCERNTVVFDLYSIKIKNYVCETLPDLLWEIQSCVNSPFKPLILKQHFPKLQ